MQFFASQTLQMRLQASEARNEDFSAGMHDSTRPLLRQIEALQTQHSVAAKNWDKIEKRLVEALACFGKPIRVLIGIT